MVYYGAAGGLVLTVAAGWITLVESGRPPSRWTSTEHYSGMGSHPRSEPLRLQQVLLRTQVGTLTVGRSARAVLLQRLRGLPCMLTW